MEGCVLVLHQVLTMIHELWPDMVLLVARILLFTGGGMVAAVLVTMTSRRSRSNLFFRLLLRQHLAAPVAVAIAGLFLLCGLCIDGGGESVLAWSCAGCELPVRALHDICDISGGTLTREVQDCLQGRAVP